MAAAIAGRQTLAGDLAVPAWGGFHPSRQRSSWPQSAGGVAPRCRREPSSPRERMGGGEPVPVLYPVGGKGGIGTGSTRCEPVLRQRGRNPGATIHRLVASVSEQAAIFKLIGARPGRPLFCADPMAESGTDQRVRTIDRTQRRNGPAPPPDAGLLHVGIRGDVASSRRLIRLLYVDGPNRCQRASKRRRRGPLNPLSHRFGPSPSSPHDLRQFVERTPSSRPRRPELVEDASDGGALSEQGSAGVEQLIDVGTSQRAADGQRAAHSVDVLGCHRRGC